MQRMPRRFLGSAGPGVAFVSGVGFVSVAWRFLGAAGPGVVGIEVFAGDGVVVVEVGHGARVEREYVGNIVEAWLRVSGRGHGHRG